jgi:hypothetical protein
VKPPPKRERRLDFQRWPRFVALVQELVDDGHLVEPTTYAELAELLAEHGWAWRGAKDDSSMMKRYLRTALGDRLVWAERKPGPHPLRFHVRPEEDAITVPVQDHLKKLSREWVRAWMTPDEALERLARLGWQPGGSLTRARAYVFEEAAQLPWMEVRDKPPGIRCLIPQAGKD